MNYKSILLKSIPNIQTYYLNIQKFFKDLFVFLRYLPGNSLIYGPPRGIYLNSNSYNGSFPKENIQEILLASENEYLRVLPNTNSKLVKNKFEGFTKVKTFERKVFILPKARYLYGYGGTVITKNDKIFLPCSPLKNEFYPKRHQSLYILKTPKRVKLDKVVLMDTLCSEINYCHWLRDHVLRFFWLKSLNIDFAEYTLVSSIGGSSYHHYTYERLKSYGFNFKDYIATKEVGHFDCNELIVAPTLTPAFNTDFYGFLKEEWHFLRDVFVDRKDQPENKKRIFLSRRKSNRSSQDEVKLVKKLVDDYGFQEIFLENINVRDQANLFNNAEIVIGLHGAGFTNLCFCKPSTLVFEIFSPDFIVTDFWDIANQMNLNYFAYCNDNYFKNITSYRLAREEPTKIDVDDFITFFLSKL